MGNSTQLSLFDSSDTKGQIESSGESANLGTFKDNAHAPVHGWFRYPAGYSYKFVEQKFEEFGVCNGDWVYDPFSGSGTTLVCAQKKGINGFGVEAHSFVHWVASVKLYWGYDLEALRRTLEIFLAEAAVVVKDKVDATDIAEVFPALVYKCYYLVDLKELYLLRELILNSPTLDSHTRDFLKLALTDTLRASANAGTGWPYISPRKTEQTGPPKQAFLHFEKIVSKMYADVVAIRRQVMLGSKILNVLGDSRQRQTLYDGQVKLALTSPPYLNNYDYADRTRLETYFWGITTSWKDITVEFRNKLMVAATTQIVRSQHHVETALSSEIQDISPQIYEEIQAAVLQLAALRTTKGGKKDYDLMVALYFNDILSVVQETFRVLRPGGKLCLVLGDSAPYGVHIPTESFIGRLGLATGFADFQYQEYRSRGNKWKANPQRHTVALREGVVTLTK